MIDYAERVEEVCLLLNSDWGVGDRQAIELLLAARIPMQHVGYPWLILETQCYAFDLRAAWFNLGSDDAVSLPQYRVRRPRTANEELTQLLAERDRAGLFVEPNFDGVARANYKLTLYPYLMQNCLRLRSKYPKRAPVPENRLGVLRASVKGVMDSRWRGEEAAVVTMPPWLLYFAELLQRCSETQRDWGTLITNLCRIAQRRAYLFNRAVNPTDWQAVGRVMSDSIPLLTGKILGQFAGNGRWHSLRGLYPDRIIHAEIKRLTSEGLVWSHQGRWRLVDPEGLGKDVLALASNQIEVG